MHFNLVDAVLERTPERIITLKQVSNAEEYLLDHFPGFPVLPGVMMIEALIQAGRELLKPLAADQRLVLGSARAIKYGSFVRPGESLRLEVSPLKPLPHAPSPQALLDALHAGIELKGEGVVLSPACSGDTPPHRVAVSGRFTLRSIRL